MLSIIVACGLDRSIGVGGKLLWSLPSDLRYFRELTLGHSVVMGSRTFFSLPSGALPGRRNIVLSRTLSSLEGAEVYRDVSSVLGDIGGEQESFIIGGGEIYNLFLPYCDKVYLTEVSSTFPNADTHFPDLDSSWECISSVSHPSDSRHMYPYTFKVYLRK